MAVSRAARAYPPRKQILSLRSHQERTNATKWQFICRFPTNANIYDKTLCLAFAALGVPFLGRAHVYVAAYIAICHCSTLNERASNSEGIAGKRSGMGVVRTWSEQRFE
jgi:hypothetical protein